MTGLGEGVVTINATQPEADPAVAALGQRLDDLTDLFRRRLLEDRDKRRLLEHLEERLLQAESGLFRDYLHPLVMSLALVVDRLDAYAGADRAFAESVCDEILDAMSRHGILEIPGGPVDAQFHEVTEVSGEAVLGTAMSVLSVQRRGFRHGEWIFRPARVLATVDDGPSGSR